MTPLSLRVAGGVSDSSLMHVMDIPPLPAARGSGGRADRFLSSPRPEPSRSPAGAKRSNRLAGAGSREVHLGGDGPRDAAIHCAGSRNLAPGAPTLSRRITAASELLRHGAARR